jgi:ABC-type Fe3+-siderophore transport system permease subunit
MDPLFDEILLAARRLLDVRAILCGVAVAVYGFAFGWVMSNDPAPLELAELAAIGGVMIAAAAFAMKFADFRAERARKRRLDALLGRHS